MPYCFVRVPWKLFREHGPVTKLPAIEVGNAVSAGSVVPTSVRSNDAGFEGSGATTWKPTPPAVPVRDEVAEQLGGGSDFLSWETVPASLGKRTGRVSG